MKSIELAGKAINGQAFTKLITGLNTGLDLITTATNAACLQAAQHGNLDWLITLFKSPAIMKKAGGMTKQGAAVADYCKATYPALAIDKKSGAVTFTKSGDRSAFRDLAELKDGRPVAVPAGVFPVSFSDYQNIEKAKAAPKAKPSLKAATVQGRITKAMAELTANNFAATADECAELTKALAALMGKVASLHTKKEAQLPAEAQQVDAVQATKLLASGQAGKSKRAGGKVAAVA